MRLVNESGMAFITDEDKTFYIESGAVYQRLCSHGVAAVEFIKILSKGRLVFIEAKTTVVNKANHEGLEAFIRQIEKKFHDSVEICYAILHDAQKDEKHEVPASMTAFLQHSPRFIFVVVVKNIRDDDCTALRDLLAHRCNDLMKIWGSDSMLVLNERMARKKNIIE